VSSSECVCFSEVSFFLSSVSALSFHPSSFPFRFSISCNLVIKTIQNHLPLTSTLSSAPFSTFSMASHPNQPGSPSLSFSIFLHSFKFFIFRSPFCLYQERELKGTEKRTPLRRSQQQPLRIRFPRYRRRRRRPPRRRRRWCCRTRGSASTRRGGRST